MRAGGGKQKGAAFERFICEHLSLWVTSGVRKDVFWRSAMSGGRATVHGTNVRQCGDICAVAEEGYKFASQWFVECKHVKDLNFKSFLLKDGEGILHSYWEVCKREAKKHSRQPMLIARQNLWPIVVISKHNHLAHWTSQAITRHSYRESKEAFNITLFSDLMEAPYNGER